MKGGNVVSEANEITHSPERRTRRWAPLFVFAFGELRNSAPVSRSITAFHILLTPSILFFLQNRNYPQDLSFRRR